MYIIQNHKNHRQNHKLIKEKENNSINRKETLIEQNIKQKQTIKSNKN